MSKGEGLTVQKASQFPQDPQKLATNSLKFKILKNAPKVGLDLPVAGFFITSPI
jgi:hypothetical protein